MKRFATILALTLALALAAPGALAEGTPYSHLGETLPDFSVATIDGGTFTLSDALAEKDMVLINLWATWCGPCRMEFPYMEAAYERYRDRVEIIALSVEPGDTKDVLTSFAAKNGLTFKIANEGSMGLGSTFATEGIPTTLVVDRFGVICYIGVGSQPSESAFTRLFEAFLGDDYAESLLFDTLPPAVPDVTPLEEELLNAALNAEGGELVFRNPEGKYVWPMSAADADGRAALVSTNAGQSDSASAVLTTVSAAEGDVLAFDFFTSSEAAADLLTVSIDGAAAKRFGGAHEWTQWALALDAGEHEIVFSYTKDGYADVGDDLAMIDNVRIVSGEAGAALLDALPVYPTAAETSFRTVGGDALEIVFDDPNGVMADLFGCQSGWIVPSGTAEAKLAVTAGVDPETAFFYSNYDGAQTPLIQALGEDGNGYAVSTRVDANDVTGYPYTCLYFYPDAGAGKDDVYGLILFVDEDNVNALLNDIRDYYGVGIAWAYAESAAEPAGVGEGSAGEYTVRFVDQDGGPVPGCIINFCTDDSCSPVTADENGVAVFTGEPYAYHLQVIKVPAGYEFDRTQEFYASPEGGEMILVVVKK